MKKNRQTLFIICTFLFLNTLTTATLAAGTDTGTDIKPFSLIGAYLTTSNGNSSSTEAEVTTALKQPTNNH